MATETATIRVSRETRDRLAVRASERKMSVSAFLSELVRKADRDAVFSAERAASRADVGDSAARAEDRAWEMSQGDGLD